jgi:hypothetical protein
VVRAHKLATLEKDMVELFMGKIDNSIKEKFKLILSKLTD